MGLDVFSGGCIERGVGATYTSPAEANIIYLHRRKRRLELYPGKIPVVW